MKKRKISYDLTAQQKKKLRRQQNNENSDKFSQTDSDASGTVVVNVKVNVYTGLIVCICALVLAAVMIVLAIGLPIWTGSETVTNDTFLNWANFNPKDPENPFTAENPNPNPPDNPIVTVTLTGDNQNAFESVFGSKELKIDVELYINEAKYSAINLMYLAESGFYDNTIINDINNQHAMFCGFTDTSTKSNKAREGNIIYNLKGFLDHTNSNHGTKDFKLGYRLAVEKSRKPQRNFGYLVMLAGSSTDYSTSSYYGTSTSYMFLNDDSQKLYFGDVGDKAGYNIEQSLSWVGRVMPESFDALTKFNEVETVAKGNFLCPINNIRISSIRTNLSSAKRKYLLEHFEELIKDGLISNGYTTQWKETNFSETYYKFED